MTKENLFKLTKEYSIITVGVFILAFGLSSMYLPNDMAVGGLTGLALVVNKFIPGLSVSGMTFICNAALLIGAFKIIDKDFGIKTLYSSFILSTSMEIVSGALNGNALINNIVLAALIGPVIMATGLSLLICKNASTGGTEILAKILNKYSTINIAIALLMIDLVVTICGGLTFGMEKGIFALIAVLLTGVILNKIVSIRSKESTVDEEIFVEDLEELGQYAN